MHEKNEEILERLRRIRRVLRLNQGDFGEGIGMALTSYASIEQGRNSMNDRFKKLLQHVYNVNLDYLETGRGEMFVYPRGYMESREAQAPYNYNEEGGRQGKFSDTSQEEPGAEVRFSMRSRQVGEQQSFSVESSNPPPELKRGYYREERGRANESVRECGHCVEKERLITRLEQSIRSLESELERNRKIIDYLIEKDKEEK